MLGASACITETRGSADWRGPNSGWVVSRWIVGLDEGECYLDYLQLGNDAELDRRNGNRRCGTVVIHRTPQCLVEAGVLMTSMVLGRRQLVGCVPVRFAGFVLVRDTVRQGSG